MYTYPHIHFSTIRRTCVICRFIADPKHSTIMSWRELTWCIVLAASNSPVIINPQKWWSATPRFWRRMYVRTSMTMTYVHMSYDTFFGSCERTKFVFLSVSRSVLEYIFLAYRTGLICTLRHYDGTTKWYSTLHRSTPTIIIYNIRSLRLTRLVTVRHCFRRRAPHNK